ncbi:hypothetical protein BaRGS_00017530 [Batillaria attramentaria]|uniref:Secreted protein n=1 Tax=Batillaria attramentaria TaxID=370345 RepID=A0ABD0KWJ0_9CAEN
MTTRKTYTHLAFLSFYSRAGLGCPDDASLVSLLLPINLPHRAASRGQMTLTKTTLLPAEATSKARWAGGGGYQKAGRTVRVSSVLLWHGASACFLASSAPW